LKPTDKFLLVTNRPNKSGELENESKSISGRKRSKDSDVAFEQPGPKRPPRKTRSWKIAQALTWVIIDSKTFEDDINSFAYEFGCVESEIKRGIDVERPQTLNARAVRDAIKWFHDEEEAAVREGRSPSACLVITCRQSNEVVSDWVHACSSGFPSPGPESLVIKIGKFSIPELLEASHRDLNHSFGRFYASAVQLGALVAENVVDASFLRPPPALGETSVAIESEVFEMLRHPVMWRSMLALSPELRQGVLDNERGALNALMREFTDWFCRKARTRGVNLSADVISLVLSAVARCCNDGARQYDYKNGWLDRALSTEHVSSQEARVL
jgi:hypothetical protein